MKTWMPFISLYIPNLNHEFHVRKSPTIKNEGINFLAVVKTPSDSFTYFKEVSNVINDFLIRETCRLMRGNY